MNRSQRAAAARKGWARISEEARAKRVQAAHAARRRGITATNVETGEVLRFESLSDAHRELRVSVSTLSNWLKDPASQPVNGGASSRRLSHLRGLLFEDAN